MRLAAAAAALALSGCGTSILLPAAPGASLDPIAFFTGRTQGSGTLDRLGESPVPVHVDSVGRLEHGTLIVDQTIREGAKPPRVRRWTMRPAGPNRYVGTLTDAEGPVQVRTVGPRAYVSYAMEGGFQVEQQLALQGDGRTLLNRLDVKKLGVRVAKLDETIRKRD